MSVAFHRVRARRLRRLRPWRPSRPKRILQNDNARMLSVVAGFAVVAMIVGGVAVARTALPLTEAVQESLLGTASALSANPALDVRSKVYAKDGTLVAVLHGQENREPVPLARVPVHVRRAVIAIEDDGFYGHDGVDVVALGRAMIVNSARGEIEQGGGTITMQLARNSYLQERSKTFSRKMQEIAVARSLEKRLTKNQILEEYLNTVYFGWGAYGVEAAAEAYFGKTVERLTLSEGAFLAGLIKSPARLDPRTHMDAATRRKARVLTKMRDLGLITSEQRADATREAVRLRPLRRSNGIQMKADAGATFVEYVKQRLLENPALGATREERTRTLFEGGLQIHTTLDLEAERAAERAVRDVLDREGDPSAALASVEPATGAIRAMTGGTDARGFNLAAQGRRQPGSAFKPFALVAALEERISVYETYDGSSPRRIDLPGGGTWLVHNYEDSSSGTMTLLQATEQSVNAVYAQLVADIGPGKVVSAAHRMGITSPLDPYPSIALGALTYGVSPLEMASAYATLANGGRAMQPYAIHQVLDAKRKVVFAHAPTGKQVLDAKVAANASAVLQSVVQRGTGRRAQGLGRPAAAKTGTTDDYRDSWFVGFTPQLSTAVWLGYPKTSKPMYNIHGLPRVFGGSLPAEIWTRFMRAAHEGMPVAAFPHASFGPKPEANATAKELPRLREEWKRGRRR